MSRKRALITGITGQDGSYLAEFLLNKDYEVFGLVRRRSDQSSPNIAHLQDRIELIVGDLSDSKSLGDALFESAPHEIYNLAAQSFVGSSWTIPEATANTTALGVVRLLEAMRCLCPDSRFYQASSSEMFGDSGLAVQNESTPLKPRSPYAVSKVFGHLATINYRESYDLFACCGILFNHESPRRGLEFVTRKISDGVARICLGLSDELVLGNLHARRDWGFAGDYVEAMWQMLQRDVPEDFVVGTGVAHSVGEFVELAFACVGLDWHDYVVCDEQFLRPTDIPELCADASRARSALPWAPRMSFERLVESMVEADLKRLNRDLHRSENSASAPSQPQEMSPVTARSDIAGGPAGSGTHEDAARGTLQ